MDNRSNSTAAPLLCHSHPDSPALTLDGRWGDFMKKSILLLFVALASIASVAKEKERITVTVIARTDSNTAYSYAFVSGSTGIAQNLNLQGATLTLQLPNGDAAVVNCTSKFKERFAGPGNVRSCRVPLVNDFEATFDGDKAKLFWATSLDGKKVGSETYQIIAVSKVNSAAVPTKPSQPAKSIQPSEAKPAVQKAAEVSLVTVPSQAETATAATVTSEGTASVTSEPDGADIFIDSVGHGRTPALLKLKPGKHSVQVVHSGYQDWVSEVEVKTDSIVNITAALEK